MVRTCAKVTSCKIERLRDYPKPFWLLIALAASPLIKEKFKIKTNSSSYEITKHPDIRFICAKNEFFVQMPMRLQSLSLITYQIRLYMCIVWKKDLSI